jgi:hypothetical protein
MPDGGSPGDAAELSPEDSTLVTLARSARSRTGAAEGAAVRDLDGRTYVAATVALPSLRLTAVQAAVAAAASSGADRLESAAVLMTGRELDVGDLALLRDVGIARVIAVDQGGALTVDSRPA